MEGREREGDEGGRKVNGGWDEVGEREEGDGGGGEGGRGWDILAEVRGKISYVAFLFPLPGSCRQQ